MVGSNRSSTWASSSPPLSFRPWPAPLTSKFRYARVSASSEERISSTLMSGSVFATGIVNPGLAIGARFDPG